MVDLSIVRRIENRNGSPVGIDFPQLITCDDGHREARRIGARCFQKVGDARRKFTSNPLPTEEALILSRVPPGLPLGVPCTDECSMQ